MRGGFVRGGAARPHGPRLSTRSEGELLHRSLKKVRKIAEDEEFTENSTPVARKEDWMEEERGIEGAEADIHVIEVMRANNEENSKRSFAQLSGQEKHNKGEVERKQRRILRRTKWKKKVLRRVTKNRKLALKKLKMGYTIW
ncbi:hypothetical protein AHAS_Ahas16G0112200 [Arachis hypogaea]